MGIRPLTEEERQIMQDIADDLYEQFVAAVANGRNLSVTEVMTTYIRPSLSTASSKC